MTNKLDRACFDRACDFVRREGRPLDAARLNHALGDDDAENIAAVLDALAPFQNEDGGFGHGIEPDFRTPASTAMATSVGFQVLREVKASSDHPMVVAGMDYLLATLDREKWVWPIIDADVDLAAHAPWWNYSADLADSWYQFRFNPTAELTRYCFEYESLVPGDVLDHLASTLLESLEAVGTLTSYYDLRCCLYLRDTRSLPDRLREALGQMVLHSAAKLESNDPHVNYLELVPRPDAFLAAALASPWEAQVARVIQTQSADGSWEPWWEWAEVSESEWQNAQREWRGAITRLTIETLVAHGRVV